MWYKDTAGKMGERVVVATGENKRLFKRASTAKSSKVVDMIGHIHNDIFFQEKLLTNGISVRIRLAGSKDSFSFVSTDATLTYKIKIVRAVLRTRKVCISDFVYLAHAKALKLANATYPIRRVECKTFSIPTGKYDVVPKKIFMGQVSNRLIVGLVNRMRLMNRLQRILTTSIITKSQTFPSNPMDKNNLENRLNTTLLPMR